MRYHKIPDETVRRLPTYLRGLLSLSSDDYQRVSSSTLADYVGVKPWLIRKDFSYFGEFGTPGVGYDVATLIEQIKKILRLDVGHKAVLVGVGNLGLAVLAYPGFKVYGFEIAAAFDTDPAKIGKIVNGVTVRDVSKLCSLKRSRISLGIIAVPLTAAQEIADKLVKAGVRGIVNFSPFRITVPNNVKVISIDIAMDLARLPYYMPATSTAKRA
jgi:redox-sensing transcriptional repressor